MFTKPLSFAKFNYFRSKLNVINRPLSLKGDIKEAHTSIVVSRTEDDSSKVNQLRVDDVACHVMPGDYEICIHVTD